MGTSLQSRLLRLGRDLAPADDGDEDVMALLEDVRPDGEGLARDALDGVAAPVQLGAGRSR